MKTLSWDQVFARRLARNHLIKRAPAERLVEVVGEVCGIQAQVMTAAEIGLGARVDGIARTDVDRALWQDRSLIKTYGLRGTLYLLPAEDVSLWMAALKEGRSREDPRRLEWRGLDVGQLATVVDAISDSLDGARLRKEDLGDEVARRIGAWAKDEVVPAFGGMLPRWQAAIGFAAFSGALCFGPNDRNRVTFVRPDQWIGSWKSHNPEEALREVVRRYLTAYGPATHEDFAVWFGINPFSAAKVFISMADELVEVNIEGRPAVTLTDEITRRWGEKRSTIRLLPRYDCYFFGFSPREKVAPRPTRVRVFKGKATKVTYDYPALLIDGVTEGTWDRKQKGRRIEVLVESFEDLTTSQETSVKAEVKRLGKFLDGEVTTAFSKLS